MSGNNDLDVYVASLRAKIWKTKGSRFNAVRRLNNKYQFSLSSISILSIYGIAIPIIQGVVKNPQCQKVNDIYSAISLILSVFTLAISLLEGAKNYQLRAEKLHNNAVKISSLQSKLDYLIVRKSGNANFLQQLGNISARYEKLIKECPENHEPQDYTLFMAQNRKDFNDNDKNKNWVKKLKNWVEKLNIRINLIIIKTYLFIKNYLLYVSVLGIPPAILILLYWSC